MQPSCDSIVAASHSSPAAGGVKTWRGDKPVEFLVRGDADEGGDGFHSDDGVFVSEEGTKAVHASREDECRHELPSLPVLQVQQAQVRDLWFSSFRSRGPTAVTGVCVKTQEHCKKGCAFCERYSQLKRHFSLIFIAGGGGS